LTQLTVDNPTAIGWGTSVQGIPVVRSSVNGGTVIIIGGGNWRLAPDAATNLLVQALSGTNWVTVSTNLFPQQ
jgi:hypothetical protein